MKFTSHYYQCVLQDYWYRQQHIILTVQFIFKGLNWGKDMSSPGWFCSAIGQMRMWYNQQYNFTTTVTREVSFYCGSKSDMIISCFGQWNGTQSLRVDEICINVIGIMPRAALRPSSAAALHKVSQRHKDHLRLILCQIKSLSLNLFI